MTFRARLTLAAAAAVAVAVALASGIVFLVVRGELRGQVDTTLRQRADVISQTPLELVRSPDLPASHYYLHVRGLGFGDPSTYLQVVSADGAIARPEGADVQLPVSKRTLEVAAAGRGEYLRDAEVAHTHVRILTVALEQRYALQVLRPLTEVDRVLHRLGIILVAISLGGVLVAAIVGALVARAALAPVRRLTRTTERVAETRDLSERLEVRGHDELSRLADSFNTMLEALEASLRAQRQLVADASHELRTPLTSLRTNSEVLARSDRLPPESRERLLRDVLAQLEEMTALVADVVELARERSTELAPEDVQLDQLVAGAVERARRHAPQVDFVLDGDGSVVRGVPSRIERAVANLLDNAAKWSPAGGRVEVSVGDHVVTVRDHGPGIAESDLPFVFDRFYRAPSARGLPGSGLGLAIVRQVAETHHGEVTAEAAEGGGTVFRLRIGQNGSQAN